MSYPGREWLRVYAEREAQIAFWRKYEDRLTPDETRRITRGDYAPIRRPWRPEGFHVGRWITVRPKLEIHVAGFSIRGQDDLILFDKVRDHRGGGGRVTSQRIKESLADVTTLSPGDHVRSAGEPEKVPDHVVEQLPSTVAAKARYEEQRREERKRRLEEQRDLPIELRLARMRKLAKESHVDISAEERVIQRRIEAIERKLLDEAA